MSDASADAWSATGRGETAQRPPRRPVDAWTVVFDGFDPGDEGRREALCTTGNGCFATRGAAPESSADGVHYPGTYAAGVFNRLDDVIEGRTVTTESMVNLPNWLPTRIAVDDGDRAGEWIDPFGPAVQLTEHRVSAPVITVRDGGLVGIVTEADLVRPREVPAGRASALGRTDARRERHDVPARCHAPR